MIRIYVSRESCNHAHAHHTHHPIIPPNTPKQTLDLHTPHSITSLTPGTTLQHHPHQLLAFPSCSLTRYRPAAFSSPHSGTQAPTLTILTSFFLTTPPIPSISCLAYPGPICPPCTLPGLELGLAALEIVSNSLASSASQSISCSTSLAATHFSARPQGTPRLPSPMPTPRPPREGR